MSEAMERSLWEHQLFYEKHEKPEIIYYNASCIPKQITNIARIYKIELECDKHHS
mgnify:FL=1